MELGRKLPYRYCMVPKCNNTTITAPDKLFFNVPRDDKKRSLWVKAMRRDEKKAPKLSNTSSLFCCEDHFSLEDDMLNFWQWKLTNSVKRLKLKLGVVPHRFECQRQNSPSVERGAAKKKTPSQIVQEALESAYAIAITNEVSDNESEREFETKEKTAQRKDIWRKLQNYYLNDINRQQKKKTRKWRYEDRILSLLPFSDDKASDNDDLEVHRQSPSLSPYSDGLVDHSGDSSEMILPETSTFVMKVEADLDEPTDDAIRWGSRGFSMQKQDYTLQKRSDKGDLKGHQQSPTLGPYTDGHVYHSEDSSEMILPHQPSDPSTAGTSSFLTKTEGNLDDSTDGTIIQRGQGFPMQRQDYTPQKKYMEIRQDQTELFFLRISESVQRLPAVDQARIKMELGKMVYEAEIKQFQEYESRM